jgi:glycosyltransferase involved in cell wall biosynthesis
MKIGFDAKRAFKNRSGLGNYSRSILSLLNEHYPENEYLLYTPSTGDGLFHPRASNKVIIPSNVFSRIFSSAWRSICLNSVLKKDQLDIYHGLSNELPLGIEKTKIHPVVTIHDLIFMRYPSFYPFIDREIYKAKFRHACNAAELVLATSEATRQDIISFFGIKPDKIKVAYQTCNPSFRVKSTLEEKEAVKLKYNLPSEFILSVGTIEARKNAISILKAIHTAGIDTALVLVGRPTPYVEQLKEYIAEKKMEKQVIFLHSVSSEDLPAVYQSATLFAYPSQFEGFGIPILEALFSGIPVVTSKGSCFGETGGDAAEYTDPNNLDELSGLLVKILADTNLRNSMISKGYQQSNLFSGEQVAKRLMELYQQINA